MPGALREAKAAGSSSRAIDWIRIGELPRDKLGWADYPSSPEEDAT
jgi:hypothetical protein